MSDKPSPIPLKSKLFFFALLIIMFFIYRYPFSIQKGPYSIHMWRQACDLTWTKEIVEQIAKEDSVFKTITKP